MKNYSSYFNQDTFLGNVGSLASKAGKDLIEKALILYYVFMDVNTPVWVKVLLAAALGYLICPLDAIPDVIPVAGFTDDLGVIASAILKSTVFINDDHKAKAKKTLERFSF